MFSFFTTSSMLQNQDVKVIHRKFIPTLLAGLAMLGVLVATPQSGFCAQTTSSAGATNSRRKTASVPHPPSTKTEVDPTAQELARRFKAAQAAAASGDPDAVMAANKKLAAIALRQLGNLRLLERAAPQAVEILRESIALEDVPDTRMALAVAVLNADQPDETLAQTAKVLAADPANARAWFLSGRAWMAKNDYPSAVDSFQHALQLHADADTRFSLALSLLKLNEKNKAQAIFKQMLVDYGDRAIWHVIIAGAYREADSNDEAAGEFRRAIALDDAIDHAHFFLGLTLLQQNHWAQTDTSMAEFREAARLNPEDYFSNFYLGAGEAEFKLFDSSNRHLMVASEKQPEYPEPWLYLGLNAFQQQDFPVARKYLEKAIETTGKDESRNNYQLKRVYIALSRIAFNEGKKEEAQKYAQKARDLQNKSLAGSAESVTETMEQGGMGQAAAVMPHANLPHEQATSSDTVDPTAQVSTTPLSPAEAQQAKELEQRLRKILSSSLNDWGTSEARQGMFSFALEHLQEAEKWDNTTPGLMRNLGLAALRLNNIPEAVRALTEAVEIDPGDAQSRARLAMTLYSNSQYVEAAQQFGAIGDAAYQDPGMAYAWAYSLVKTNQSKQAVLVLNRLSDYSLPAEILVSIGDLYAVLEFYEPAVTVYRKALQDNPDTPRVHYKTGAALLRLDRAAEAATELELALKQSPDDPDVQFNLAYALLQTSQKERALQLLRTVITNHPDHPEAQYKLGKALLEDGHVEDALPHLEAAAKLDPERDYVHYQLQVAYRRLGRVADADNELKIYREIKAQKRERPIPHSSEDQ